MHELSIAATVMEDVLGFVEARGIGRVVRVRLAIGELTCIQPEQLKFCYESVTRETPLADSQSLLEAGIVDSTGVLELVTFLESGFGIAVADAEIVPENLDSIGAIVAYVTRKRGTAALAA